MGKRPVAIFATEHMGTRHMRGTPENSKKQAKRC